jgi:hypothetical protein
LEAMLKHMKVKLTLSETELKKYKSLQVTKDAASGQRIVCLKKTGSVFFVLRFPGLFFLTSSIIQVSICLSVVHLSVCLSLNTLFFFPGFMEYELHSEAKGNSNPLYSYTPNATLQEIHKAQYPSSKNVFDNLKAER